MLVLGIDPGIATTGYGVITDHDGKLSLVDFGTIVTSPTENSPRRLQMLYQRLTELMQVYQPSDVVVEQLFFSKNARTAIAVGQARGVVLLAAADSGIPVSEYTPLQIKQAVAGYGAASKEQVQEMVRILLDMDAVPRPDDAADALAAAICHEQTARFRAAISEGT